MDEFLSVIEAWVTAYKAVTRAIAYEQAILENLKKNETTRPFAQESINVQARKINALIYVCDRIKREACLEGINGRGVQFLEDQNSTDGVCDVQAVESGETPVN